MQHEKEAIIKVQQGSKLNKLTRGATALAGIGLCAGIYTQVRDFELPSWNAPELNIDLGDPKQALDDSMAQLSQREAEPLYIDPKDVLLGKITEIETFGSAERPMTVAYAEKKYNTWVLGADEWVKLRDGQYMTEAFVAGPARVSMGKKGELFITMNAPKTNNDVRVVRNPRTTDDPQIIAEIGQIPGKETSVNAALDELHEFVISVQKTDKELHDVAACTAVRNTTQFARQVLEAVGKDVSTEPLDIPEAVAYENPQHVTQHVTLKVFAQGLPAQDGFIGPRLPEYTLDSCQTILDANSAVPGSSRQMLPESHLAKVKLQQENK